MDAQWQLNGLFIRHNIVKGLFWGNCKRNGGPCQNLCCLILGNLCMGNTLDIMMNLWSHEVSKITEADHQWSLDHTRAPWSINILKSLITITDPLITWSIKLAILPRAGSEIVWPSRICGRGTDPVSKMLCANKGPDFFIYTNKGPKI